MSKFDKFRDIFKIGSVVAKPFIPGAAGSILEAVTQIIDDDDTPNVEAIKVLAKRLDEYNAVQDQAILALHERLRKVEKKLGL